MSVRLPAIAGPLVLALGLSAAGGGAGAPADRPDPVVAPTKGRTALERLPAASVVTDGPVRDLVRSGDRIYLRGGFRHIGRFSGPGRILDAATGADRPAPVFGAGQVSTSLADGAGGWYAAGDIDGGLVHVLADGRIDPEFSVTADGLVSALARDGDVLYLGGLFDEVDGTARRNLAAVSATDGSLLAFAGDQEQRVTELAFAPAEGARSARVFVGSDHLEALDPVTGAPVPGFTAPRSGEVHALAFGGDRLYVGTAGLAALDPATGSLDPDFIASVRGPRGRSVHTLLLAGDTLYAGGDVGTIWGRPGRLVALDAHTGRARADFAPEIGGGAAFQTGRGGVFSLALSDGRLWVGGAFATAGGAPAANLAVLDPHTGAAVDGVKVPRLVEQVNTVETSGDAVYLGGHFFLADPLATQDTAALDATTLRPLRRFRAGFVGWSGELVAAPNALYLAPTHFAGYSPEATAPPYFRDTTRRVFAMDPRTGAVDDQRTHRIKDLTGVTTIGNRLVVARRLQDDVRFPRNRIIVYRANGKRLTSFRLPLRGYITELDVVGRDLLVAGSFKRRAANGGPRDTALLRIDPASGKRRAWFDPHIDGPVNDVSVRGRAIYASGLFAKVYEGYDVDRPGLTKMDARSRKRERFDPDLGAETSPQRAVAAGDLVWVTGPDWQHFLDAATGDRVPDPAAGFTDQWIRAVTGDARGLVLATSEWVPLAGYGAQQIGWVARVER